MSLADRITVSRIIAAPLILVAAANGFSQAFLAMSLYGFATDAGDGIIARTLNSASEKGARLDSRADLCFYPAVFAGLLWLFPAQVGEHLLLLGVVAIAYVTPIGVGWFKFRRLTSYHTLLARVSLGSLAAGLFGWLWFDEVLPLQAATIVLIVSALEELAITRMLSEPRDNISTVFRLLNNKTLGDEPCIQEPMTGSSVRSRV